MRPLILMLVVAVSACGPARPRTPAEIAASNAASANMMMMGAGMMQAGQPPARTQTTCFRNGPYLNCW